MAKYTVFMTDTAYLDTSIEEAELLAIDAELRLSSSDDPATLLAEVADCDALLVNFATVGADVINALSRCKIIVSAAIGVDNIDVEAATRRGIMVANVLTTAFKRSPTIQYPFSCKHPESGIPCR